ncbi:MAG: SlyX family protein [Pseudomonadales bacterium]
MNPVSEEVLQQRVDELEMRLAFQEDVIQTLHEQITHLQQETEKQQQMLQVLYRQWREMQESTEMGAVAAAQEKPPHY